MRQIELENRVTNLLQQMRPVEAVEKSMSLRTDFGVDSLSLVNLLVMLEEEFQITLAVSDLSPDKIQLVEDLYRLIQKYVDVE